MSSKQEAPLQKLADYLPPGSFERVVQYLLAYRVHLIITRRRRSILGDYRQPDGRKGHRISVNGNLNPYAFLLTLLHELAHLLTYLKYGNSVSSHGAEWKQEFRNILLPFVGRHLFPMDVEKAVARSLHNPAASSCADEELTRVLHQYDPPQLRHCLVEELQAQELFQTGDGRVFKKGERIRKRYRCEEMRTGRIYLFSPLYEVQRLEKQ